MKKTLLVLTLLMTSFSVYSDIPPALAEKHPELERSERYLIHKYLSSLHHEKDLKNVKKNKTSKISHY